MENLIFWIVWWVAFGGLVYLGYWIMEQRKYGKFGARKLQLGEFCTECGCPLKLEWHVVSDYDRKTGQGKQRAKIVCSTKLLEYVWEHPWQWTDNFRLTGSSNCE